MLEMQGQPKKKIIRGITNKPKKKIKLTFKNSII